jgi:DNA-binding PadR family transcriptional regulator
MRPKKLTHAELAILGIIGSKPCYGYEIDKLIEKRKIREWVDIGFSSIYALLKKLEQQELIESELIQEGNTPPRKIYHITDYGKEQLTFFTKSRLSDFFDFRSAFDVALGNIQHLPKMEVVLALREYERKLDEDIENVQSILNILKDRDSDYNVITVFQRHLVHLHAEKKWLINLLHQVWEKHEALTSEIDQSDANSAVS